MSSINNNYDSDTNYDNYNSEYDSLNNDIDGADSASADDPYGDSEGTPDAAAARDELKQLEQQIKNLSPEAQKNYLDTLTSLDKQLTQIGTVDNDFESRVLEHIQAKMSEIENQVVEFSVNGDQLSKNEEILKGLEEGLKTNPYIKDGDK